MKAPIITILHVSFSLAAFLLLAGSLLAGCAFAPAEDDRTRTGDLYGKLHVASVELASPEGGLVRVEGTDLAARADADGLFYIPDVPVGTHHLVASLEGFKDRTMEGVEVGADSISFVINLNVTNAPHPAVRSWAGRKIARVPLSKRGSMAGTVYSQGRPRPDASVSIPGTFWSTRTDSLGRYRIDGILSGAYSAFAAWSPEAYGSQGSSGSVRDVRIVEGNTTIIDVRLRSSWLR